MAAKTGTHARTAKAAANRRNLNVSSSDNPRSDMIPSQPTQLYCLRVGGILPDTTVTVERTQTQNPPGSGARSSPTIPPSRPLGRGHKLAEPFKRDLGQE